MIVFLFSHALWSAPQAETRGKRVQSPTSTPRAWSEIKCLTKPSFALKKFLRVNQFLHVADRSLPPFVSDPQASQTDRRKTVARYFINTGIIKIWGVLDSVYLDVSPPETVEASGVINQAPLSELRDFKMTFKHLLYVCTQSKLWDSKLKFVLFCWCHYYCGTLVVYHTVEAKKWI